MGFSESFGDQQNSESNLEYDDTAFQYFFLALQTAFIVPLLYLVIKPFVFNPISQKLKRACKCPECQIKAKKIKSESKFKFMTFKYKLQVVLLIFFIVLFFKTMNKIDPNSQSLKKFDPWEILGLEPGSDLASVKKVFRSLSRKYHPDVAEDKAQATAKFILIQKAYECLTDETKRDICAKYGSPDGPGKMNVAIAMPQFLLNKDNHVAILFVFFVLLLIILPTSIYMWYNSYNAYDSNGTLLKNQPFYYMQLNENTQVKQVLLALSLTRELNIPQISKQQSQLLVDLGKQIDSEYSTNLGKFPQQRLPQYYLLCAYIQRIKIAKELQSLQDKLVNQCPRLLQSMITFIMHDPKLFQRIPQEVKMQLPEQLRQIKFLGAEAIKTIILVQQMFSQALNYKQPDILQLGYFKDNELDSKKKKIPSLKQLLEQDKSERKLNFLANPEDEEIVNKELDCFPQYEITHFAGVEGEDQITDIDLVKIQVKIKTKNCPENEAKNYIHTPYYPSFKDEKWHFLLYAENNSVVYYNAFQGENNVAQCEFITQLPKNKIKIKMFVAPDSYLGFNYEQDIQMEILDHNTVKRKIIWSEDDQMLDKHLNVFEQMMQMANEGQENHSDDDEEEEEEEEEEGKQAQKKDPKQKKNE